MSPRTPQFPASCDFPWFADQRDGTYRNPLFYADYPDPDVIRDGDDYFMTVSSFHVAPGLPILHSRDLVNWSLINHALPRLPHPRFDTPQPGCGVWAPAIRKHAGKFWIFFPMPDEGIYVTTADHPASAWSEPHLVQAGRGLIDPCPLWDDDGNAYLVHAYAFSRSGLKHKLRVRPMAPDASRLLGEGQIVYDDPTNHPTLEGPKFLKRNGYYYILAPAGGVETGWQLALRSRNVYGPYECRTVLEQGTTPINGPHQGGLVDTPTGESWFIHFQDATLYGRIPHLQPARWVDDWPQIGVDHDGNGIGEPVARHPLPHAHRVDGHSTAPAAPITSDDFDAPTLSLQWHWNANPQSRWHSLTARPGWLRLFAAHSITPQHPAIDAITTRSLAHFPSILLQKFPATAFTAETLVDFRAAAPNDSAGIAIIGRQSASLVVCADSSSPGCLALEYLIHEEVQSSTKLPMTPVRLFVHVAPGGLCTFGYQSTDEGITWLPRPFQATPGVWIGAKVGLFAAGGQLQENPTYADFDYLRFHAPAAINPAQTAALQTASPRP